MAWISPTNLSLTHSPRSKVFNFSWTAWSNNWWSCKLQYYKDWTTWTDISATTYNCDTTISNQSVTLPWDWWNGAWSSIQVRVIKTSDSEILSTFSQNLTCSAISGSATSTPSIDEDCNWAWDNYSSAWTWVLDSTDKTFYYWGDIFYPGKTYNDCITRANWKGYTYISLVDQPWYAVYNCYANASWTKSYYTFNSAQQYIKNTWSFYQ
jgi:hypothetical protein